MDNVIKAHRSLVKFAIHHGYTIAVDDGGRHYAVEHSRDYDEIINALEAVDDARMLLVHGDIKIGVYVVHDYGEMETVNNWTLDADGCDYPLMADWLSQWEAELDEYAREAER